MRVAIVHPWFIENGGGERVVDALLQLYPGADVFALMANPRVVASFAREHTLQCSFLNRVPGARRFYQHMAPLYRLAIESLDLRDYDLVISSGGPASKGVILNQNAVHVHYCHSPVRFLWDQFETWRARLPLIARQMFTLSASRMRRWDYDTAQRVDRIAANSAYISDRILKYYGRQSTVIYPPVDTKRGWIEQNHDDYYLSVSRLVPGKRVDLLVEACNRLGRKLVIAGDGPEMARLRLMAGPTVELLGRVDESVLTTLYAKARAFVFAAEEDFGIAPVEAQSFGRPVIAYGKGGCLETVVPFCQEGRSPATGVLFPEQTIESVCEGISTFELAEHLFDAKAIQRHASRFDLGVFSHLMRSFVAEAVANRTEARRTTSEAAV
jgi:glycosyltransferase involved in cell wall biosynthesis